MERASPQIHRPRFEPLTAPTVTPADTARHLELCSQKAREQATERARRLRQALPDAVRILRTDYGVRRILLFGSLATRHFGEYSDVDLAVEGLSSPLYFAALADLMAHFGAPVDLVRLEEAPESLRDRIAAEGKTL